MRKSWLKYTLHFLIITDYWVGFELGLLVEVCFMKGGKKHLTDFSRSEDY